MRPRPGVAGLTRFTPASPTLGGVTGSPRPLPPFALLLLALLGLAPALAAQPSETRFLLPEERVRVEDGTVTLRAGGADVSYVPGLGWLNGWSYPAPEVTERGVLVPEPVAAALSLPRLAGVRFGGHGAGLRVVLDVRGVARERLEGVAGSGRLREGEPLVWRLPSLLLPADPLEPYAGLEVEARAEDGGVTVRVAGPAATFEAFTLADPTRLVLDLAPSEPLAPSGEERETLAQGAVYRRFRALGGDGPGTVHVVELAPGAGELRVVGGSGEGRSVSEWAGGAPVAINAGYFDPSGFRAIGLRRIDGGLLSLPSRNRAAVGFGPTGTAIARAGARVRVRVDGHVVVDRRLGSEGELEVSREPGVRFGDARHGLVRVREGTVVSNRVGPGTVPEDGFALSYDASLRPLALVEPGARLDVSARLLPAALERSPWAVEAGPLLIEGGEPAFEPGLERFQREQRILDAVTQQAALGVRADGTVLLVVAERMRAEDLIPLLLDLGAHEALRLDSGSSATLLADGEVRNRLFQREVSDAIVWSPAVEEAGRAEGP